MKLIVFTALLVSLAVFAADNDGDLLLDSWEAVYGISTNRADSAGLGIGDYFDDPDHDGLPNHAERAAAYVDTNASYSRNASEQWGYHRLRRDSVRPFAPAVVLIRPNTSNTVPVFMMGPR